MTWDHFVHRLALWAALAPAAFAQSYTMATFAGSNRLLDGHAANTAPLRYPFGMAQDASGNVYFADYDDNRIRKVDANGIISTLAGDGMEGYTGDNGPAVAAELDGPQGVKLDGKGNLYIADYNNDVVRKIVLSTGIITTVAGNGKFQFSGDGGQATDAGMDPYDIAVDTVREPVYRGFSQQPHPQSLGGRWDDHHPCRRARRGLRRR